MENQSIKLNKALKNSIIAGSLVLVLIGAYYLVIFLPKKEAIKLEQQKQETNEVKQQTAGQIQKPAQVKSLSDYTVGELYDAYNEESSYVKKTVEEIKKYDQLKNSAGIHAEAKEIYEQICSIKNLQKETSENQLKLISKEMSTRQNKIDLNFKLPDSNYKTTSTATNKELVKCLTFYDTKVMVSKDDCDFIKQLNKKSELSLEDFNKCLDSSLKENQECIDNAVAMLDEDSLKECEKEAMKVGKDCLKTHKDELKDIWKNY